MKPMDLNTLLYIVGAISLLFGLLMLLYYRVMPNIKGPLSWALGSLSVVVGTVLFAAYPIVPGYFAFVIGGSITIASIAFYLSGIQLFRYEKYNHYTFYVIIITQFVSSNFFYLVYPNPQLRMSSFSLISVVASVIVIVELIKPAKSEYRLAYILISVVFGISALTSLNRALAIFILRPEEAHVPISANLVFYFMGSITQALLMFAFLLLISLKIAERLEQKVQAQRKFYSIIAHDLSGPVGMMNVMLNMVSRDGDIDEVRKNKIYGEVENLSGSTYHLLQNLLYWSRNQLEDLSPVIKKFDLDNLIQHNIDLMSQLAKTKNLEIEYSPNPDLICNADVRMIDTVIRNLISNAIKFSHSNNKIDLECGFNGPFIVLRVTDYGVGMNEQTQKNLYLFNGNNTNLGTRGERGSGLGLSLCKEFIEGNGGSIQIFSKEDEGTEVTVTIPSA